jgi:hypothetical protein
MKKDARVEIFREIPIEKCFRLSDPSVIQDKIIKNRYWFTLPEEWTNQLQKDPILGFRNIFVQQVARYFNFTLRFYYTKKDDISKVLYDNTLNFYFTIYHNQSIDDALDNINKQWNEWILSSANITNNNDSWIYGDICFTYHIPTLYQDPEVKDYQLVFYVDRHRDAIFLGSGPNNGVHMERHIDLLTFSSPNSNLYNVFTEQHINDAHTHLHIKCWDRQNVLVKSNLSNNSDLYLGFSRGNAIIPLKYYRLTSDSKRFWIELWSSHEPERPSILPPDKRDDLYMETVFCYSSNAML